ncbi:MAG: hypothetical protein U0992_13715 [Planctomycetaceae bacterium]
MIAIAKCDLADKEQLELVDLEIDDLVAPTMLAAAREVKVSAHTGQGIATVEEAIVATCCSRRCGPDGIVGSDCQSTARSRSPDRGQSSLARSGAERRRSATDCNCCRPC